MAPATIWYLVKFYSEEKYADEFISGKLHLKPLSEFKKIEDECVDGRFDATEGVATWWQPNDIIIKLNVPGVGECEITSKDLAGPVSISFDLYDAINIFCMYAINTRGFVGVDENIECTLEEKTELERQLKVDERCLKLGKYAVITPAVQFLEQLKVSLQSQGYRLKAKLVKYYDDEIFRMPTLRTAFLPWAISLNLT